MTHLDYWLYGVAITTAISALGLIILMFIGLVAKVGMIGLLIIPGFIVVPYVIGRVLNA